MPTSANTGLPTSVRFVQIARGDFGNPYPFSETAGCSFVDVEVVSGAGDIFEIDSSSKFFKEVSSNRRTSLQEGAY